MDADHPVRILFVEDVPSDMELAERVLRQERLAFTSRRVETKAAFLKALDEFLPDLIISDYALPEFDGLQALKLSLEQDAALPFIVFTGSMNEETAVACMKAGATDYVLKERIARLPFAVREALEQRQTRLAKEAAERALRESEARYRMLVEQAADGIFIADSAGKHVEVNSAGCAMLGYAREELLAMSMRDLAASGDLTTSPLRLDDLQVGNVVIYEQWLKRKDGSLVPVEISGKVLPNGHLQGIVRDITDRKRQEIEILATRSQLKATLDAVPDMLFELGLDGRYHDYRAARTELLVAPPEGILGKTVSDILPPDVANVVLSALLEAHEKGWSTGMQFELQVPLGKTWFELSVSRKPVEPGREPRFIVLARDITERKRAEETLRIAEANYRTIFEQAPVGIYQSTPQGRFLSVNPAMAYIYGYDSPEEMLASITDIAGQIHVNQASREELRRLLTEQGEILEFTNQNYRKDGSRIWTSTNARIVKDEEGKVLYYEGFMTDITERKRAEEALRESQERYRQLFEAESDAITLADLESERFVDANPAAIKLYGYTKDELMELAPLDLSTDPDQTRAQFDRLRAGITGQLFTRMRRKKDGTRFPVELSVSTFMLHGRLTVGTIARDITERQRAEDMLVAERNLLSTLIDNLPDYIFVKDVNSRIVMDNIAHRRLLGATTLEAVVGKTDFDFFPKELAAPYYADEKEVIQSGESLINREEPTVDTDSNPRWLLTTKVPLRDRQGMITGIVGINRDITARKRAEEALRESEARFSTVFHASPVGISITHLVDGQFIDANSAFLRTFGYTREEVIGHTWRELQGWVHPEERDRLVEVLGEQGRFQDVEVRFRGKSGEIADVLISAEVIELAGGQYVLNLIHDITERKQRQRELEAIAAMAMALRAAPTRADMLPVIVHQVFNLLRADGAALVVSDPVTGESVIAFGQGPWADWTGRRIPPGAGISGHVIATGQPYLSNDAAHDSRVYQPDFAGDLGATGCAPLIAHDETIGALWAGRKTAIAEEELRLLTAISDIAANALQRAGIVETLEQRVAERTRELAQANERLEELDRLKSKFVSDVSHELRTPVAVLKLHAELLEHGRPEKREHYVKVIGEQADRQAQLVEDILNLSRLELGADKVQFAPVALNTLVSQIVEAHQPAVEAAGLTLVFTPDPVLPPVRGEDNQLAQVITNLIANAINYTPAGRVQVSTGLKDRQVVVEVRDTGMGIAPEDLPHLFERFYRGKRTRQIRGTGLGLAIVKEIVDLHGGSIEVESEVGVGSTFRMYLPIVEREA